MGQFMTTTRIAIAIVLFAATARGAVVVGDKPTLRVHTIDGTTFDLKDYKGKLVLVDFFFGRSDLDRAYHQHLLDLHNRQKDKGLVMVSICCAPKVPEVQQAIVDYKIDWPVAQNAEGFRAGLPQEWGCPRLPFSFLIGPDGKVLWADMKSTVG